MDHNRKMVFLGIMGSLTGVATLGCVWQRRRYYESSFRWEKINETIRLFKAEKLSELPYNEYTIKNKETWEYKLVEVVGKYLDNIFFVLRTSDGRMGYQLLQELESEDIDRTVYVNRGWVPLDQKAAFKAEASRDKPVRVVGMLKKGEHLEVRKKDLKHLEASEELHLVHLAKLNELSKGNAEELFFIERMVGKGSDEQKALYPYATSKDTYIRPYLTPQKHLEYSTFWGLCSGIGLLTIIKILRM